MRAHNRKPLLIRGVYYPSHKAAAAALGVTQAMISLAIRRGRIDFVGLGPTRCIPVRIRGVDYPSINSAAKALGLHHSTIQDALDKGTLETVGLSKKEERHAA